MKKIFIVLFALTFVAMPCMAEQQKRISSDGLQEELKLESAIVNDDVTAVKYWLERGAEITIRSGGGLWGMGYVINPLGRAIEKETFYKKADNNLAIIQLLLDYGADMNEDFVEHDSALMKAVQKAEEKIYVSGYNPNDLEIRKLKLLLDNGAKKHILGKADKKILYPAISIAGKSLDLAKLLLSYDIPVRKSDIKYAKQLQEEAIGKKTAYNYNRLVELLESKRSQKREEAKRLFLEEWQRSHETLLNDPNLYK